MSKKRCIGKAVIGFDETNNGFNLESPRYERVEHSTMVVTGYLIPEYKHAMYGTPKYGGKKRTFNKKRDLTRAFRRGKLFIEGGPGIAGHPDFLYTTIPKPSANEASIYVLKANAIALLTFEFMRRRPLNPANLTLIFHETDGKINSQFVNEILDAWLHKAGMHIPHYYSQQADKKNPAVRYADIIGYYLAAIKFLGDSEKWPYRRRKVNMNQLEQLAANASQDFRQDI